MHKLAGVRNVDGDARPGSARAADEAVDESVDDGYSHSGHHGHAPPLHERAQVAGEVAGLRVVEGHRRHVWDALELVDERRVNVDEARVAQPADVGYELPFRRSESSPEDQVELLRAQLAADSSEARVIRVSLVEDERPRLDPILALRVKQTVDERRHVGVLAA